MTPPMFFTFLLNDVRFQQDQRGLGASSKTVHIFLFSSRPTRLSPVEGQEIAGCLIKSLGNRPFDNHTCHTGSRLNRRAQGLKSAVTDRGQGDGKVTFREMSPDEVKADEQEPRNRDQEGL